jgi:hypothetical protein
MKHTLAPISGVIGRSQYSGRSQGDAHGIDDRCPRLDLGKNARVDHSRGVFNLLRLISNRDSVASATAAPRQHHGRWQIFKLEFPALLATACIESGQFAGAPRQHRLLEPCGTCRHLRE